MQVEGAAVAGIRASLAVTDVTDETDPVARALAREAVASSGPWWRRWDAPNWLVAAAIYGAWVALVMLHAYIPWPILMILAAYVLAWHFSLQHEAIHAWRTAPPVAAHGDGLSADRRLAAL